MKRIKFIDILFVILFVSCEDIFDKQPLSKISDSDVWQQQAMIEAYVTDLYSRFPFNDPFSHYQWHTFTDEGTYGAGNTSFTNVPSGGITRSNDELSYWDYGYIRDKGFGIIYIPTGRTFNVNLPAISGDITCWWYNPSTGAICNQSGKETRKPFKTISRQKKINNAQFVSPSGQDWILILDDASKRLPPPGAVCVPFSRNAIEPLRTG